LGRKPAKAPECGRCGRSRSAREQRARHHIDPQRAATSSFEFTKMQNTTYDAIVVGSGISGGWAAKELTEKGLNVLMLERGKNIEHIKDYVNAQKAPWDYPHRGGRTKAMEDAYPVLKSHYALNEKKHDWWASD